MTRISSVKVNQATSRIEPVMPNSAYWQHYGLDKDPLSSINDNIPFIPTKWEEYSDKLADLCQHRNLLLAIIGVNGSGKTTFLKEFIAQIGYSMYIHRVDADPSLTSQRLVEIFAEGFKVNIPKEETLEECLDAQLFEIQQSKKLCLLVFDNAHQLPLETLETLLDLLAQQSDTQMRLHILLAGEPSLVARLDSLDDSDNLMQTIMFDGLSLEDTEQYLQHRLNSAGYNGDILFSPSAVARIYRLSSGIPSRINRLAQRMLYNAIAAPTKEPSLLTAKQIKLIGAILLLLILATAALLLSYLNSKPLRKIPVLEKASDSIAPIPMITPTDSVLAANKQAEQSSMISVPQAEAILLSGAGVSPENSKRIPTVAASTPVATPSTPAQLAQAQLGLTAEKTIAQRKASSLMANMAKNGQNSQKMLDREQQAIPASDKNSEIIVIDQNNTISTEIGNMPNPQIASEQLEQERKQTTLKKAIQSVGARPLKDNKVVVKNFKTVRVPGNYSLQIIGSHQLETINKFLIDSKLKNSKLKENIRIILTTYQDQDWYILLYGEYPSIQAAQMAVMKLPTVAQKLKPWPRKLSTLQKAEMIN